MAVLGGQAMYGKVGGHQGGRAGRVGGHAGSRQAKVVGDAPYQEVHAVPCRHVWRDLHAQACMEQCS